MKKLLSLVLALAMLLGCVAFAEGVDYTGTWVITGLEEDGVKMGSDELAAIEYDLKFILYADGTSQMSARELVKSGTWIETETGVAVTDDESNETVVAVYQNEMLVFEADGSMMIMSREDDPSAIAEEMDYIGVWTLTSMMMGDMAIDPLMLGMSMTMELLADGTCNMSAMGESKSGNWTATETGVTVTDADGGVDVFILEKDTLTSEMDGMKVIFTYGEVEAPAGLAAMANVAPEEFEGQWLLTRMNLMGMEISAADMGMYMAFVLADGTGILGINSTEDGSIATAEVTYTLTEEDGVGTVMTITGAAEDGIEVQDVFYMAQNGVLFMDEDGVVMVFERQVEENTAD